MNAFDDVKINLSVLPPSSCAYAAIQLISMTAALPRIQRQRVIHPCRLLLHRPRIKSCTMKTPEKPRAIKRGPPPVSVYPPHFPIKLARGNTNMTSVSKQQFGIVRIWFTQKRL